jgi:hypothetical protein
MSDNTRRNPLPKMMLAIGLAAGAWYFFKHFEIHGLHHLAVQSKSGTSEGLLADGSFASGSTIGWPPHSSTELVVSTVSTSRPAPESRRLSAVLPATRNLRVATWALGGFGPEKLESSLVIDRVASVIREFDVIAIQQLRASQRDFIPYLLARASGAGRNYDYLLGSVHEPSGEQLAFIFDTTRIVTDRTQLYTVADPDNRMTHDPLVGWFRARELEVNVAWTFSLVNVRVELPLARQETAELPRILNAVARDGRGEDDCIIAGLFQADDVYLLATLGQPAMKTAIKGTPTDIFARHQTSNLAFNDVVTTESIGRGGVVDFLRRENLSLSEAEQVSPYLPVYAEFSIHEGGIR